MRLTKETVSTVSEDIIKRKLIHALMSSIPDEDLDKLFSITSINPYLDRSKALLYTESEFLTDDQKLERAELYHLLQFGSIEFTAKIEIQSE